MSYIWYHYSVVQWITFWWTVWRRRKIRNEKLAPSYCCCCWFFYIWWYWIDDIRTELWLMWCKVSVYSSQWCRGRDKCNSYVNTAILWKVNLYLSKSICFRYFSSRTITVFVSLQRAIVLSVRDRQCSILDIFLS